MQIKQTYIAKWITAIAFILLALFILQIANNTVYTHTHILADGRIITHAHPYNKTNDSEPFKSHQHNQTELLFFKNLEVLFPFIFLSVVLLIVTGTKRYLIREFQLSTPACILIHKGRAPPVS
ncbi:MAG: hypothetical protein JXB24_01000 [Bacteroidales bacterium]|nr:hypothetical protein [Bacteroidales bacterium]